MRALVAISAMLVCHSAAAQLFKCTDRAGKTTYSSTKCSELGLKDAGEIRDMIQVTPAPATRPSQPARTAPVADAPQEKPAAAAAPKDPERRCFTITAAGGKKVTRCNDKPDEPAN